MIEIMESNINGVYNLSGNSNDEINLTGIPLELSNGKILKNITTGSTFLNVETRNIKFFDKESNEWMWCNEYRNGNGLN